jgi:hypothetical protein
MKRHLVIPAAAIAVLAAIAPAEAAWIFYPSRYSHDPATGQRVVQFAPAERSLANVDPTYQQSVYRHNRSSLRIGDSADRIHIVETWGQGDSIRPYGEWLYPFREGATPYGPWGNPQGPWTDPFGAWVNPYGLGRLRHPPWPHYEYPYASPTPRTMRPPAENEIE